ncbi:benzaldehyde dehydrogenase (NAD) [Nocardioides luteus]|uniref:Aldehyde dehydrogenase n=1 Tax=Nocardioides luteus TaxID=1844 RepID=A0ABQ5SW83_9ACTN|nr:aldehyde dehydrogenase family protein [Nocardioides luteus]MDR7312161.1 benzaldehyde dehydrogenase (NAD) [Nocardioides luteus]GGR56403.1 aldehyde dehydrogenase [Nocardioides luteus]GLJ68407.1 aldehyde dehydrogenase [Nocardioides luteus]
MGFFDQDQWTGRAYVGGWVPLSDELEVSAPARGDAIASLASGGAADVDRAVSLAAEAQREWAARPAAARAEVMRRAAAVLTEHQDVLVDWLVREAGSGQGKAAFEAGLVADELHHAAATALVPYGQLLQTSQPRLSLARHRPVGVVGVISPFNFPAILAARSVFPALALGNAVVLKPDPRTSVGGGLFLAALMEEAGLPAGLLAVVPGRVEAGSALVEHPDVPVISFTGSTEAGRIIGERAGRLLKRAHLELGGNNAMIVMPGVDVAAAASAGAWGSFLHQGQICMTTGRHLVHAEVYDEYVATLAAKAAAIPVGDPTTGAPLGPVIDAGQRDKVHALVTASVEAGARLETGGTYQGLFYRPTVLSGVTPDHPAFAEEIFGPVAPVTRFETVDEAVDLVRRSDYGLSVGILTADPFAGYELADRIPSGIVHVNDQTVGDEAQAPFGGIGASGTGARFGGHEANVEAFTETQWVTVQSQIQAYPF